jgi:hypothetical protein
MDKLINSQQELIDNMFTVIEEQTFDEKPQDSQESERSRPERGASDSIQEIRARVGMSGRTGPF